MIAIAEVAQLVSAILGNLIDQTHSHMYLIGSTVVLVIIELPYIHNYILVILQIFKHISY